MHSIELRRPVTGRGQSRRLTSQSRQHSIHRRAFQPEDASAPAAPRKALPTGAGMRDQTDAGLDGPYNPVRGEQAMWRAVISQTLMDARNRSGKAEMLSHRIKAVQWLTGMSDDFRRVCEYAGLDPVFVRQKARTMLKADAEAAGEPPFPANDAT